MGGISASPAPNSHYKYTMPYRRYFTFGSNGSRRSAVHSSRPSLFDMVFGLDDLPKRDRVSSSSLRNERRHHASDRPSHIGRRATWEPSHSAGPSYPAQPRARTHSYVPVDESRDYERPPSHRDQHPSDLDDTQTWYSGIYEFGEPATYTFSEIPGRWSSVHYQSQHEPWSSPESQTYAFDSPPQPPSPHAYATRGSSYVYADELPSRPRERPPRRTRRDTERRYSDPPQTYDHRSSGTRSPVILEVVRGKNSAELDESNSHRLRFFRHSTGKAALKGWDPDTLKLDSFLNTLQPTETQILVSKALDGCLPQAWVDETVGSLRSDPTEWNGEEIEWAKGLLGVYRDEMDARSGAAPGS